MSAGRKGRVYRCVLCISCFAFSDVVALACLGHALIAGSLAGWLAAWLDGWLIPLLA